MKLRLCRSLGCSAILVASLFFAANAFADSFPVTGYVWAGAMSGVNPYPGTLTQSIVGGLGSANIAFTGSNSLGVSPFNMYSSNDTNLAAFLMTGINGLSNGNVGAFTKGGNQTGPACPSGCTANYGMNNDIMEFTGQTFLENGSAYSITKDDAVLLQVGSDWVLGDTSGCGTATSPETCTFNWGGPTGYFSYDLWYTEENGAPAELYAPDLGLTPEPRSLLLLGTGMLGLAFLIFRKNARTQSAMKVLER